MQKKSDYRVQIIIPKKKLSFIERIELIHEDFLWEAKIYIKESKIKRLEKKLGFRIFPPSCFLGYDKSIERAISKAIEGGICQTSRPIYFYDYRGYPHLTEDVDKQCLWDLYAESKLLESEIKKCIIRGNIFQPSSAPERPPDNVSGANVGGVVEAVKPD